MWLIAMFDLPVYDKPMRKAYAQFRKALLKDGFAKMQYSVYIRHCTSKENAEVHFRRVELAVPDEGEVRMMTVTDKQYERMSVFWGKRRRPPEPPPAQLDLF
ncbi:MAG: CRISPR-associated endonuclease Cas2 [Phycisphaerae bacterium]|nr:CRISPR-associated endonuclease Cas2 [Phycisphaerae bacterium]